MFLIFCGIVCEEGGVELAPARPLKLANPSPLRVSSQGSTVFFTAVWTPLTIRIPIVPGCTRNATHRNGTLAGKTLCPLARIMVVLRCSEPNSGFRRYSPHAATRPHRPSADHHAPRRLHRAGHAAGAGNTSSMQPVSARRPQNTHVYVWCRTHHRTRTPGFEAQGRRRPRRDHPPGGGTGSSRHRTGKPPAPGAPRGGQARRRDRTARSRVHARRNTPRSLDPTGVR